MDLPDQFRWGEHLDRPTLYYRHHRLADYQDGRDCWVVCIGLHRMAYALRKIELPNRERAIRYVQAWARRWGAELREEIGEVVALPQRPEVEPVHCESPELTIAPRRPRRSRRTHIG